MSTTLTLHHDPPRFLRFLFYFFLLTLTQFPPPATAQLPNTLSPPPPQEDRFSRLKFDKSMAIVLVILVAVFFVLGFLSVYTRQCAERRMRGRFDLSISISIPRRQRGLDRDIIETFPTFVYSTVKSRKIGLATLECAVCLNEFEEDETLRLIPKCSHVFHPDCIDAWLANHSTCPVCRANLVPKPDDPSFLPIQFPDPEQQPVLNTLTRPETDDSQKVNDDLISETENRMLPLRSRSTGHSLVQPGENCERFTLHLPEEVRNQLMLSRTKSCGVNVTFTHENSERRGYRTRSVGSTAPHVTGWFSRTRSVKDDVGERSSDRLFSTTTTRDSEV